MPRAETLPQIACIALGSNLGDRRAAIENASAKIATLPGTTPRAMSTLIETAPVGPPGQGDFLNAAASIETTLSPRALLDALLRIEQSLGRVRGRRWGPRTIDLDLILFGDLILDEPGLTVPHPMFRERLFVLGPLAEIEPGMTDPVTGRSVLQLLADRRVACGGIER
ncbi:MAG TPA: 2-amino-4-hydroxy-6-hydroxymethyldihydropteridine diphosphokinase [Phycisphaerales bacterium]|nr:2-amino-4-hydroxy-6-hydroxymethyldihydropteridine diphosphokinase [Phycisphaerales bacterium]